LSDISTILQLEEEFMAQSTSKTGPAGKPLALKGLFPATVTPFTESLAVDYVALEAHLREMAEIQGVTGIVVNSGLGEILQLTPDECDDIIRLAIRVRRPDQLVLAGVDGRSAADYVAAGKRARAAGADALLVLPLFDKRPYRRLAAHAPTVYSFFAELDSAIDLPMVIFQYPPNSGCAYPVEVLRAIAELKNVVAVKVATMGDMKAYAEVWDALKERLSILAGVDSPPLIDMLRHGAHGALIGIGAILPQVWADLLRYVSAGDRVAADALFEKVCKPLMASVFENQQPKRLVAESAASKEALVQLGRIPSARVRPPAMDVDEATRSVIRTSLVAAGLVKPIASVA
jgi:4-hydroxy-tetrahydrodipicolinate synthase